MRTRPSTTKRPTRPRRRLCACGCRRPADLLHQIAPDEAYHRDCALSLVLFALRNPDLLAGVSL